LKPQCTVSMIFRKHLRHLKHNNACGVASRPDLTGAWKDALAGDPVSAFGGILITNGELDVKNCCWNWCALFEVIIAPAYDIKALDVLKKKKNRIILLRKPWNFPKFSSEACWMCDREDRDLKTESVMKWKPVTKRVPASADIRSWFCQQNSKTSKSNTIAASKK